MTGTSPARTGAPHQRRQPCYLTVYCDAVSSLANLPCGRHRPPAGAALLCRPPARSPARGCSRLQSLTTLIRTPGTTFTPGPLPTAARILAGTHLDTKISLRSFEDIPSPKLQKDRGTPTRAVVGMGRGAGAVLLMGHANGKRGTRHSR